MTSEKNDDDDVVDDTVDEVAKQSAVEKAYVISDETVEAIAYEIAKARKVNGLDESEIMLLRSELRQAKVFYFNAVSLPIMRQQQRHATRLAAALDRLADALSASPPWLLEIAGANFDLPEWATRELLLFCE